MVRLQDSATGQFTVHLDNRVCNHRRRCVLSGSDEEGVVRFSFVPPAVDLEPEGEAAVTVRFTSPPPGPGAQSNRSLTVRATDEKDSVEATVG